MATQNSSAAALLYSTAATSYATAAGGTGLWLYQSSDPTTTIVGTLSYFTDGLQLGMKNGDTIICQAATSGGSTAGFLMGIAALVSTNSTAGFSVATGSLLLSTQ
jgi:hypothetical protein